MRSEASLPVWSVIDISNRLAGMLRFLISISSFVSWRSVVKYVRWIVDGRCRVCSDFWILQSSCLQFMRQRPVINDRRRCCLKIEAEKDQDTMDSATHLYMIYPL